MVGWIGPRGVAPARMPKAEATTGLAPKKASAQKSSGRPAVRRVSFWAFAFDFDVPTFFGEVSELRRPWANKREDRRAVFARRSLGVWASPAAAPCGCG